MHPPAPANSVPGNTIDPSLIRIYRAWKGNNVFFLGGRFIFGPDVKSIFTTLFLVIAPVAVFCAFVARKFFDDFPNHSGYSILILVILLTIFEEILA
uniref:Transmembrane protein n=1 Tax=Medicago truncatula TaxID=3880 RepID=B7FI22_MEDTR|nr:unknown [Medicago truncatula]AFK48136.1 unknown [Medicago truncatula]